MEHKPRRAGSPTSTRPKGGRLLRQTRRHIPAAAPQKRPRKRSARAGQSSPLPLV